MAMKTTIVEIKRSGSDFRVTAIGDEKDALVGLSVWPDKISFSQYVFQMWKGDLYLGAIMESGAEIIWTE